MGTAKVYLNPSLPVVIEGAHRVVYLPDSSQHILDEHDRPLFMSAPGSPVVIVMEYSRDVEPQANQRARFVPPPQRPPVQNLPDRRDEAATERTQPIQKVPTPKPTVPDPETTTDPAKPSMVFVSQNSRLVTPVPESFVPPEPSVPGEVRVMSHRDRGPDTTGEFVMPGFRPAPEASGPTLSTEERGSAAS